MSREHDVTLPKCTVLHKDPSDRPDSCASLLALWVDDVPAPDAATLWPADVRAILRPHAPDQTTAGAPAAVHTRKVRPRQVRTPYAPIGNQPQTALLKKTMA